MRKTLLYIALICLAACSSKNTPTKPDTISAEMTYGKLVYYGQYYDSIKYHVLALDLYSDGLTLDSTNHMVGSGTNLYLSDIFVPLTDTTLADGTYRCSTTPEPKTFYPGKSFEGTPTGTYILQVDNAKVAQIILCTDSAFVVSKNGQTTDLLFNLKTEDKHYHIHFKGVLDYEDRRHL